MESARSCKDLVASPGWAHLCQHVEEQAKQAGHDIIMLEKDILPDRMEVIAARAKSRVDLLREIEAEASQFESIEARFDAFKSLHEEKTK